MTPSLLELKVTPSFCFVFKIPDDVTATTMQLCKREDAQNSNLVDIFEDGGQVKKRFEIK